jgi:TetR/AcrR family transcriptional regulator
MQRVMQGRPEGHDRLAEATPQALLDAAEIVFARDGFSGARVDAIARVAGHNKALIFHYFDDKVGLYRALMTRTKQRIFAQLDAALARYKGEGADVSAERLRALAAELLGVIFGYYLQHSETARILAWEAAEGWQTFSTCGPPTVETWSTHVLAMIRKAQAVGIIRAELDCRILFTTIMSLPLIHVVSLPRLQIIFPDEDFASPAAIARAQQQLTDLLLNGMLTPTALKETPDATRV